MLSSTLDEKFLAFANDLAKYGGKHVLSNPHVGCVIVAKGRIIGTGYHKRFGGPHAEIEALNNVGKDDRKLLSESTLYVSLEPCNHQGKTPPCTDMILAEGIPRVVIGHVDPNPLMSGESIDLLRSNGVEVVYMEPPTFHYHLRPFVTHLKEQRPYTILKFAQSADFYIGARDQHLWLTSAATSVLTHKWRSEVDGILIGVQTAITDNPSLTTRHYPGESPERYVIDPNNRLPEDSTLLTDGNRTIVCSSTRPPHLAESQWVHFNPESHTIQDLLNKLYALGTYRLIIEGGRKTIDHFMKADIWDEARVISTPKSLNSGIKAPTISGKLLKNYMIGKDQVQIILNES